MGAEALGGSPIGRLVPITGTDLHTRSSYERVAYVPEPLPRELTLAAGTWTRVAAAEAALARLDQAGQQIPEPALLRRPALRREAQSTSALEGTFAPFDSVIASETEDRGALPVELREVLNYVVAAEEGFAWVAERPLTIGLIERLQQVLVANTPSELRDAGRVREQQVVIGSRGRPSPPSCPHPPATSSATASRTGSPSSATRRRISRRSPGPRWLTTSSRRCTPSQTATAASDGCSSP